MWTVFKQAHARSVWVAAAFPLLFALPAGAELAQHVIDYRLGLLDGGAAPAEAAGHPSRSTIELVKVLIMFLTLYWISRALTFGRGGRAILGDGRSALLFLGVVVVNIVIGIVPRLIGPAVEPFAGAAAGQAVLIVLFVLGVAITIYLSPWMIGAAVGNSRLTIPASIRLVHGLFWWGLLLLFLLEAPLILAHEGLKRLAVGQADVPQWILLGVDSVLTGYLTIVIVAAHFFIAKRATERAGVDLAPDRG
ncbi:MAG TPA: hypothetical protein VFZ91_06170 [Allosphingosinicella sp.]